MANNPILIPAKGKELGKIVIAPQVVNHIVKITVDEQESAVFEDGSGKRSISIKVRDDLINIDLNIKIKYGQNVDKVCQQLQNNIQRNLDLMLDYPHTLVNINVAGFKFN